MEKLIEITNPNEMEKFVKDNNYLLVDDGMDEFVIREKDLVDYIYNRNEDINVYKPNGEFLLSTIGFFLNRISYKDIMKGILTEKDDKFLLFIYLLKDKNFSVKLPKVFDENKYYLVNGEKVLGKELNNGLPQRFVEDMKIDKNYSVEIDSKIIQIK